MRHFLWYLLITLLRPPASLQNPVINSSEELDHVLKNSIGDPSIWLKAESVDKSIRPERSDPDDGSEDGGEKGKGDQISLDVSETLEKINPLTIANQVSQLFRKSDSKHSDADKKSSDRSPKSFPFVTANLDDSAALPDTEEQSSRDDGCKKEMKSESRNQVRNSCPSVIVLAGDGLGKPLELNEHDMKELKKSEHVSNDKENDAEKSFKNELRVPKEFSFFPEFPIYDNDIGFVPDPLHGLLEQQYWKKGTKY